MPALRLQEHLVEKVKTWRRKKADEQKAFDSDSSACPSNYLLVLEHHPVYTTGIRNRREYSREAKETDFAALGADFVQTDRGGLITFHGPGQMVAYPIINLEDFIPQNRDELNTESLSSSRCKKAKFIGMRWYVDTLEQTIIDLLKDEFSFLAHRSPYTGVWLGSEAEQNERKICAMGVHNSQLVTSHGLALNCNTDLTWFDHIVPCGIEGKSVTSITKEIQGKGRNKEVITVDDVIPSFVASFERNFDCDVKESDNADYIEFMANVSLENVVLM